MACKPRAYLGLDGGDIVHVLLRRQDERIVDTP